MTSTSPNPTNELVATLEAANHAYRNTDKPIMSDADYDQMMAKLADLNPDHPLLHRVEPEADFGTGKVRHGQPMLSTDKARNASELKRWAQRIEEAALDLGLPTPVALSITPKLDGIAGRLTSGVLASRGDGLTGNDITHMISKGLVVHGDGDGELVMPQAYFDEKMAPHGFSHPRNLVAGAVSADTLKPAVQQALRDQALHFVSYATMEDARSDTQSIVDGLADIRNDLLGRCIYPTDGLVIVVEDHAIRDLLGANNRFHNWMIAAKSVSGSASTTVKHVQWQVGRTGRLTPVVHIDPVNLSGARIGKVTAHNAGTVEAQGIGPGATLTITRSGEVIPFIQSIQKPAETALPDECPCCTSELNRVRDFLVCPNPGCPDRLRARFNHFFDTIGTIDLYGPVACEKLVSDGVGSIREVFSLTEADYERMGFGPGQAINMVREITEARNRPVDDFRVLAALGLENLGRGDSKKLLKHVPLAEVPRVTQATISEISGFGELTANAIATNIPSVADDLMFLANHLQRIVATPAKADIPEDSAIAGKHIVFTGTMTQGSRSDMTAKAEALGATVQGSVNGKTDYLVAGQKVGAAKITKAEKAGTTVLSEAEYLELIQTP